MKSGSQLMLTFNDLIVAFETLGLQNKPVIAHASLSAFGHIQGGADSIITGLGYATGAFIMPTHTYKTMVTPASGPANNAINYVRGQQWNRLAETYQNDMPADVMMGVVPESMRRGPEARRSMHPILSFTGFRAEKILKTQTIEEPLAPVRALVEQDGWVMLLGVDHTTNTSIHFAEKLAGRKQFVRWALTQSGVVTCPGFPGCSAGFEAIQVSGFGLAGCLLGKPEVGLVQMKGVLDFTANIVHAVAIPVMADVDTGGGNAINAAWTTERVIEMGAAGLNIEDQVFPKRCGHMAGKEVVPAEEMAGKLRACAKVRDAIDRDFVINARTDCFATMGLDEAIRRCNMYLDAGADLVFIDAIKTRADIENAVRAIDGPISVNLMDGVSGVKTELIPIPELAKIGVGRVSIPVASIMVAYKALKEFFFALRRSPTGTLPGQMQWVPSFEEFTNFIGLADYRALEKEFLPNERLEQKYESLAAV